LPRLRTDRSLAAAASGASVEPLRGGLPDGVRAVFEWPTERGRGERVVHDERDAVVVCDARHALEVWRDERRITDGFDVDEGRVLVDFFLVGIVVQRFDEAGVDATAGRGVGEVRRRAAVGVGGEDDVVARFGEDEREGVERGHPAGGGDRTGSTFERGDALLQHLDRRVAQAGVDVAVGFQRVQVGGVVRVLERVGRGLVERRGDRPRRGVRLLSRVNASSIESGPVVAHV
jgi:hypothetical protein